MNVVLDSSVLIDHLRGHTRTVHWLDQLGEQPTCSEVTRTEVIRGLRSDERRAAQMLFSGLSWMPVTEPVSRLAGEYGRRYRTSHDLSVPDLLIAATTELLDAELATANVRHFPMFPDLTAPYS